MIVRCRLFALARDLAGNEFLEVEIPAGSTLGDLRKALAHTCPPLQPIVGRLLLAIGHQYAADTTPLDGLAAEVACFPPVSGG
jgi:molybdopterin converting factor small subunit